MDILLYRLKGEYNLKKIIIAGGSGYIGQAFYLKYKEEYNIKILSRATSNKPHFITSLESCDVLINLAGESIFPQRWTAARKHKILDSRVQFSSRLLDEAKSFHIRHYIQASAVTFYPFSESNIFTEHSHASIGDNFSSQLVQQWESEIQKSNIKINTALRIGVVLGPNSKFLEPLKYLFSFYLGGRVGDGRQWVSWIHIEDLISAINFIIKDKIYGPINLDTPNPLTNKEMSSVLAKYLNRPNYFHLPKIFYKILFGEASELLTEGHQVHPKILLDKNFKFKYENFKDALNDSI